MRLGAESYQTFQIVAPRDTHSKPATCEEVECPNYARGWKTKVDLATEMGRRQASYIKHSSGRKYRIEDQRDGLVTLVFEANQPCFQEHRVRIARPEIFRVKGGDGRGNPLRVPTRTHKRPEFWVEEFAENQERLKNAIEKG